jgi:O-antigen ligase
MTESGVPWYDVALFLALGVSFHVLATPTISGVPVRLSLSDLLLGFVLISVVRHYIRRSGRAQLIALRPSYLWLLAMLGLLVFAYARSGVYSDSSAMWARLKILGFVALAAYFVVGSLLAASRGERDALWIARGFVVGAWLSALLGLVEYGAYFYFDYPIAWTMRPAALSQNPNAFGIMLAASLAFELGIASKSQWYPERLRLAGDSLILLGIFLSASRSSYVALSGGFIGLLLFTDLRVRRLVRPVFGAAALFVILFVLPPIVPNPLTLTWIGGSGKRSGEARPAQRAAPRPRNPETFAVSREQVDVGWNVRIDLAQQATAMWWQQPLLGAGLGSFWRAQQARHVAFPYVNHNTTFWLASETGVVGVVLFFGGVLIAGFAFVKYAKQFTLISGVVGMLSAMLAASVGTEVSYQRYMWCFAGLGVGLVVWARLNRADRAVERESNSVEVESGARPASSAQETRRQTGTRGATTR